MLALVIKNGVIDDTIDVLGKNHERDRIATRLQSTM
jgi:hypothetical protein